jgi:hypothetical protein
MTVQPGNIDNAEQPNESQPMALGTTDRVPQLLWWRLVDGAKPVLVIFTDR